MRFLDRSTAEGENLSFHLQSGIFLQLETDEANLVDFVCSWLDIPSEEFFREIKTIFVNNSVVDDIESAVIGDGDTLILSGAMPGLVGAMLRSDSPLKAMRSVITAGNRTEIESFSGESGTPLIRLKLFNTVLARFKTTALDKGFWIDE